MKLLTCVFYLGCQILEYSCFTAAVETTTHSQMQIQFLGFCVTLCFAEWSGLEWNWEDEKVKDPLLNYEYIMRIQLSFRLARERDSKRSIYDVVVSVVLFLFISAIQNICFINHSNHFKAQTHSPRTASFWPIDRDISIEVWSSL